MGLPVNPFVASATAAAYAQGRPYFHPLVLEIVKEKLSLNVPLKLAVDVACGTGLSTQALLAAAGRVVATDVSKAMLDQAPKDPRVTYVQAPAESLPLQNASADLITVSSAFHWFERSAFLSEARRVLRPGGGLIVYDNFFRGPQHPNADLARWFEHYYETYPSPPRDHAPFTDNDAQQAGFKFLFRETYQNTWSFGWESLVAYLMSQSNAVAAVSSGRYSAETLRLILSEQLEPFFSGEETFPFAGFIWILRRDSRHA